jgi:hypothetical protein
MIHDQTGGASRSQTKDIGTPNSACTFFRSCLCGVGGDMQDQLSSADRNLKAADEFFDLAKTASSPFMRAYYERVALRYLSSEGELKRPEACR